MEETTKKVASKQTKVKQSVNYVYMRQTWKRKLTCLKLYLMKKVVLVVEITIRMITVTVAHHYIKIIPINRKFQILKKIPNI